MDLIEGTNCISNEKDRIDRIIFDSRDDVCREYLQKGGCVQTVVIKAEHTYCKLSSSRMILQRKA